MSDFGFAGGVAAGAVSALGAGLAVWLAAERRRLADEVRDLKARLEAIEKSRRPWLEEIQLNARQEVLAIAQLQKLSVHDGLDALRRLNPALAEEVIRDVMRK